MSGITCYEKLLETKKHNGIVAFYGRKIPLDRIVKDVDAFAGALTKLGFSRGDTLTIYLPTCPEAIVAFYATSKIGVIANIVHPLMPINALKENIQSVNSKGIMYFDALINDREYLKDLGTLIECSVADYEGLLYPFFKLYGLSKSKGSIKHLNYNQLVGKNESVDILGCGDDIAVTMHSGGTDGNPKIVAISNNALNAISDNLTPYNKLDKTDDYSLVMLPIFHAFGLGVSVHTALTKQYNLCLMSKFSARGANNYIRRFNISMIAGVPVMFRKMIAETNFKGKGLARLSDIWCGGDVLPEEIVDEFNKKVQASGGSAKLMRGYGLTEVTGVCSVNTKNNYKPQSSGKPLPNTDIIILDDDRNIVSSGVNGEIAVSTKANYTNYISGTDCFIEKDGKQYVLTGDIGYLDEDGFLYVIGRKKRVIKINAINIFPSEVENVIRKIDGVQDVCVVDYVENKKTLLKAFVKTYGGNQDAIKTAILSNTKNNLIKYSQINKVVFVKEFPLTRIGKIDYKKLKEID